MNLRDKKYSTQIRTAGVVMACVVATGIFFCSPTILAEAGGGGDATIGTLADNITGTFTQIGKLIIATSYLAGLGFAVSALFKFKQHKDNPQQVPIGTPIALLIIGAVMIFLPLLFGPAGQTIFGGKASSVQGGFTGGGVDVINQ